MGAIYPALQSILSCYIKTDYFVLCWRPFLLFWNSLLHPDLLSMICFAYVFVPFFTPKKAPAAFLWWPWVTGELILALGPSLYSCAYTFKTSAVIPCLYTLILHFMKGPYITYSMQNFSFLLQYVRCKDIWNNKHYSTQF